MKTIVSIFVLVFAIMFSFSAQAETKADANGQEAKGLVFRTTSLGKWTGDELFVQHGNRWDPVEMLDMALSPPIRFSRNEPIVFASKTEVDGKEKYTPVLTVSIPAGCLMPLVLIRLPPDKSIEKFITDMDPKNYPYGSYKLVNFTPKTVISQFGTKRFSLPAGGTELVNPGKEKKDRLPIMIVLSQGVEKPVVLYSNMVINRPGKRMMMFLHPVEGRNGVPTAQVRCLVDFRQ